MKYKCTRCGNVYENELKAGLWNFPTKGNLCYKTAEDPYHQRTAKCDLIPLVVEEVKEIMNEQ